jgi:hypothetical protein
MTDAGFRLKEIRGAAVSKVRRGPRLAAIGLNQPPPA